ncbi:MAG: dihydropteroate synthase [Flavobacteriales bacterium]|nr:dihydropteroate synthase [Flavobacteriales bacterium]MCB9168064.1 dihydropteroate synthase [Flavobacteriales bacterium]
MRGAEDTTSPFPAWRVRDRLITLQVPAVMGILNVTPDSFHSGSRVGPGELLRRAEVMLQAGAAILDIGGASSRPGATEVPLEEELRRVIPAILDVHRHFPEALLSVDTWRSVVAGEAVGAGAGMVNDIGAGLLDTDMLTTVARLGVPYIAMHMRGTPAIMQHDPQYADVTEEVTRFLSGRLTAAHATGIADVMIDPGFGFGKTTAHNHALLHGLRQLTRLGAPVVAGLSRKRMINEVLGTTPAEAQNGTTALNTIALMRGASILRVHDVREAVEAVHLVGAGRRS